MIPKNSKLKRNEGAPGRDLNPRWDSVRADPRLNDLVCRRRVGLPAEVNRGVAIGRLPFLFPHYGGEGRQ
jgi:hypothetical protein